MNEKLSGCKYVYSELLCRKRENPKINMSHRFSLQEKTIHLMSNKKSLNRFLRVRIQQLKSCKKLKLNANNRPFCFVSILVARAKMIYDLFFQNGPKNHSQSMVLSQKSFLHGIPESLDKFSTKSYLFQCLTHTKKEHSQLGAEEN